MFGRLSQFIWRRVPAQNAPEDGLRYRCVALLKALELIEKLVMNRSVRVQRLKPSGDARRSAGGYFLRATPYRGQWVSERLTDRFEQLPAATRSEEEVEVLPFAGPDNGKV